MPAPNILKPHKTRKKLVNQEIVETKSKKPTVKLMRFIDHLIETDNATESAKYAGYSEKSASRIGHNLRKNPHVIKALAEHERDTGEGTRVDKTWLIGEYKKCYRKFSRLNNPSSAVSCLKELSRLGGHDNTGKQGENEGQNPPGKLSPGNVPANSTPFDDMPLGEKLDVLRRTIERLAHGDGKTQPSGSPE